MVDACGGHGAGGGEGSGGRVEELGGSEINGAQIPGTPSGDEDRPIWQKGGGGAEARGGHAAGGRGEGVRSGIVKFRSGGGRGGSYGESASDQNVAGRSRAVQLSRGG